MYPTSIAGKQPIVFQSLAHNLYRNSCWQLNQVFSVISAAAHELCWLGETHHLHRFPCYPVRLSWMICQSFVWCIVNQVHQEFRIKVLNVYMDILKRNQQLDMFLQQLIATHWNCQSKEFRWCRESVREILDCASTNLHRISNSSEALSLDSGQPWTHKSSFQCANQFGRHKLLAVEFFPSSSRQPAVSKCPMLCWQLHDAQAPNMKCTIQVQCFVLPLATHYRKQHTQSIAKRLLIQDSVHRPSHW